MHMSDWISKLDDFLRLSERDILTHAGKVSRDEAIAKADAEFDEFSASRPIEPSQVDKHFDAAVGRLK